MRGGVSSLPHGAGAPRKSSPRAWGCFYYRDALDAGMAGLPHVRGGVSASMSSARRSLESSPRAWGCFSAEPTRRHGSCVFPTCVGVFPRSIAYSPSFLGLPHVRGGVSAVGEVRVLFFRSSPRAWGCFLPPNVAVIVLVVFPTCVGVFLRPSRRSRRFLSLPHVRGGVSFFIFFLLVRGLSSPRAWGCFSRLLYRRRLWHVFPTCVGVFLRCRHITTGSAGSSPRAWGCFPFAGLAQPSG